MALKSGELLRTEGIGATDTVRKAFEGIAARLEQEGAELVGIAILAVHPEQGLSCAAGIVASSSFQPRAAHYASAAQLAYDSFMEQAVQLVADQGERLLTRLQAEHEAAEQAANEAARSKS